MSQPLFYSLNVAGNLLYCYDHSKGAYTLYRVVEKTDHAPGKQKVYNIETDEGNTIVVNDVMVLQK